MALSDLALHKYKILDLVVLWLQYYACLKYAYFVWENGGNSTYILAVKAHIF